MYSDDRSPQIPPAELSAQRKTSLHLLLEEATRQLNVCNACRYCEGFCAVFPALAGRRLLNSGDISQLANLCHDCRACFDACMYAPPHEFGINVPKVLSAVRAADYRRYVWPATVPRLLTGRTGLFSGAVIAGVLVVFIAMAHAGAGGLVAADGEAASPYRLIPYPVMLVMLLVPAAFAMAVTAVAARRYWTQTGSGAAPDQAVRKAAAAWRAVRDAATLRYLRGGGGDCYYPQDDRPSPSRRRLHALVAYGFGLCAVSTVAAGVLQDIARQPPPYLWLSVPVISGTAGGASLIAGCTGLLALKARSSPDTSFARMTVKDYGLLTALTWLALTGLATLLTRSTAAFGIVFLIHLSSVMLAFATAPYSKLMHAVLRFLALLRDSMEREARRSA